MGSSILFRSFFIPCFPRLAALSAAPPKAGCPDQARRWGHRYSSDLSSFPASPVLLLSALPRQRRGVLTRLDDGVIDTLQIFLHSLLPPSCCSQRCPAKGGVS